VQGTNKQKAIQDIAEALEKVFKKYTRQTREAAWEKITSKRGDLEMKKLLQDPNRPLSNMRTLWSESFKHWINTSPNCK